ncbi:MAG: hypothetical protein V1767_01120 [Chloroflexota bacterium]
MKKDIYSRNLEFMEQQKRPGKSGQWGIWAPMFLMKKCLPVMVAMEATPPKVLNDFKEIILKGK